MQTNIKSIIAILLIIATTVSCDNYLDLKPEDGIVRDEFWQTKEDVQSAVIGIYSSLLKTPDGFKPPTDGTEYNISEYLFMFGEMRADMAVPGLNATADQIAISTSNILPSNDLTSWHAFYRVINFCNTVIDLAPGVREKDPTLSQTQLNHYLSEALAIRAYMYFTLARTFKDVPLKLTATLSDSDDFQIPTSSQNDVFVQVEKDLALAEQYAVKTYGDNASDKGRITVYTINAMQTDLYLWMERYPEALAAANKVIDSGRFKLVTNNWFSTVIAQGNSSEGIFEFQYTKQNLNPFYDMFKDRPEFSAGSKIMDDVFGVDYANPSNKDVRGEDASIIPGTKEIYKYTGLNSQDHKASTESDTHWFVYRYSDILLLKAEALTELAQENASLDEPLAIIKTIRTAREATSLTEKTPTTKDAMIDYILEERARELAYEGKRWFDVLRNAKRNNYRRLDLLQKMAVYSAPPDQQQSILAKLNDYNSHYLPINIYDIQTNHALVQNPFYN